LLLVGWGWTDQIVLPGDGGSMVSLNFDSPELRSAIAQKKPTDVLLFVHAKDMVPVMSERFTWPGPGSGPITVSFRNRASTTVANAAVVQMAVVLNRPSARIVRFLDDADKPVGGLKVSAAIFWANDNHCGRVSGAEPLLTGVTDNEGRLNVPAGDFKYVFEMPPPDVDPGYAFTNPDDADVLPSYVTVYLDESETVIRVRKEWQSIHLRVYAGDKPLAGAVFSGGTNLGLCGAGWAEAGVSDDNGDAIIGHFQNEILCLANSSEILWKADPKDLVTDFIEIRLPATARERRTIFSPCP